MSIRTDLYFNNKVTQTYNPIMTTADQNTTAVDMKGFGDLLMNVNVGASGDTLSGSVYILLELEHSDDNVTFEDCANSDLTNYVTGLNTGTFAKIDDAAEDNLPYFVGYKGNKRYVRVVLNLVGTHTNGTPLSVTAIQGMADLKPQNASTD